MTASEIINGLESAKPQDGKTILKYIAHIKEDGMLDALLGNMSGSDGAELTKEQAGRIVRILEDYGYRDSNEKASELLDQAAAAMKSGTPLTPELESVKVPAARVMKTGKPDLKDTMDAYEGYESWLSKNDWFRYEIQHAMVCLNAGTTLAGGTRMIIENKIGKV